MPSTRCRNEQPAPGAGAARRPAILAAAFLLAELIAMGMVGCGGGGDDSGPTVPLLPWQRLRRNDSNTALASNDVGDNEGARGSAEPRDAQTDLSRGEPRRQLLKRLPILQHRGTRTQ